MQSDAKMQKSHSAVIVYAQDSYRAGEGVDSVKIRRSCGDLAVILRYGTAQ